MWEVVANGRSKHIYIKEQKENKMRAVAIISTGMVNNTERALEDAELIADEDVEKFIKGE